MPTQGPVPLTLDTAKGFAGIANGSTLSIFLAPKDSHQLSSEYVYLWPNRGKQVHWLTDVSVTDIISPAHCPIQSVCGGFVTVVNESSTKVN